MLSGLIELPVWGYVAVALGLTHVTIVAVTVFLHRHQAHRALVLHPAVAHFFRLWLWLTTGMATQEWVAVHRKHHARVETAEDPHSPKVYGLRKLLLEGAELYRAEAGRQDTLDRFGHGTPDDWLERRIYRPHPNYGPGITLIVMLALFGPIGLTIWAVQMIWIPFFAAGVINGVGHYAGYRNYETADASTNIVPWGIVIGGEELHNNHHACASSARFSTRWWEFDIGWLYIRLLQAFGLARVKKVAPRAVLVAGKEQADSDTLAAVLAVRFQVMSRYARTVLARVHAEELRRIDVTQRPLFKRVKRLLGREEAMLTGECQEWLQAALEQSQTLAVVYAYKLRLQGIWQERTASPERLLAALQEWCREAEASGIRSLQEFARTLPRYSLATASA